MNVKGSLTLGHEVVVEALQEWINKRWKGDKPIITKVQMLSNYSSSPGNSEQEFKVDFATPQAFLTEAVRRA